MDNMLADLMTAILGLFDAWSALLGVQAGV